MPTLSKRTVALASMPVPSTDRTSPRPKRLCSTCLPTERVPEAVPGLAGDEVPMLFGVEAMFDEGALERTEFAVLVGVTRFKVLPHTVEGNELDDIRSDDDEASRLSRVAPKAEDEASRLSRVPPKDMDEVLRPKGESDRPKGDDDPWPPKGKDGDLLCVWAADSLRLLLRYCGSISLRKRLGLLISVLPKRKRLRAWVR